MHNLPRDLQNLTPEQQAAIRARIKARLGKQQPAAPALDASDIAVIGMSGRFPKASSVTEFWHNLKNGVDAVTEVPSHRWMSHDFYDPDPTASDRSYSKWAALMEGVDWFDPLFFKISPTEARWMDPQQRLFLEEAWHAIEDAAYTPRDLSGRRCGVFVGVEAGDYLHLSPQINGFTATAQAPSILASRIAYALNLKGPALAVDTACSSSLVAIHQAVQSLRTGESDLALAGGVQVYATPINQIMCSKNAMLSPDGRCFTFDDRANGIALGEAVGVVLLKPLAQAISDGDHIYGVIKGSGINQDGTTKGITAPSALAQRELEQRIYNEARVNPETITYVECHGTGTKLGDPIEVTALTEAFAAHTTKIQFCALGSAKSNVGHTATAAGVVALIKVLLSLQHKQIPPSLNYQTPNRHINFEHSPFYVNTTLRDWTSPAGQPRRAALSSFGFSGTNAHMVVEEYNAPPAPPQPDQPVILVLSARDESRLRDYARCLHDFLCDSEAALADVAYTLQVGREAFEYRLAVVAADRQTALNTLEAFLHAEPSNAYYQGRIRPNQTQHARIAPHDLSIVAQAWTQGATVEWQQLYSNPTPRRISAPTYPFARESYWLTEADGLVTPSQAVRRLHPLIHENISTLSGPRFESTFTGEEFFLTDHQVHGQKILPGVAYLEMARVAGDLAGEGRRVMQLRNVVWQKPIIVDDRPVQLYVDLLPDISGTATFQVRQSDTVINARGQIRYAAPDVLPQGVDVNAVRQRCHKTLTRTACYQQFQAHGLTYGPTFQRVEQIISNNTEALATLAPLPPLTDAGDYGLHLGLLDSALHSVSPLIESAATFLPYKVGAVILHQPMDRVVYAYANLRATHPETAHCEVLLLDAQGQVCVELQAFGVKALNAASTEEAVPLQYYHLDWQSAPLEGKAHNGPVLIVAPPDKPTLGDAIAEALPANTPIIRATWTLDSGNVAGLNEVKAVYYLAGLTDVATAHTIALALYRFVKLLDQSGTLARLDSFKVITHRIHAFDVTVQPDSAALSGLTLSMAKEYPRIDISCVDVCLTEAGLSSVDAAALVAEHGRQGYPVVLRGGRRYIRRLVPLELPRAETLPYRVGGVYLILGGAGGLGLATSLHLARKVQAKLVLVGRSPRTADLAARLEAIQTAGGDYLYCQADGSDPAQMQAVISQAHATFGPIHGVIHSALVLEDASLHHMSEDTFQAALRPKVQATLALYEAIKHEPLDFMLFYSSGQAFQGDAGLANYTAGCTFKDAFAAHLNQTQPFVVRTINWGYWGEVGIVASAAQRAQLAEVGIHSIGVAEGLAAMARVLSGPVQQVGIFKAERHVMTALKANFDDKVMVLLPDQPSVFEPTLTDIDAHRPTSDAAPLKLEAQGFEALEQFAPIALLVALQQTGLFQQPHVTLTREAVKRHLAIIPKYERLSEVLLNLLESAGYITVAGPNLTTTAAVTQTPPGSWDRLAQTYPMLQPHFRLVQTCLDSLPQILRGEVSAPAVIFPDGSPELVTGVYQGSPLTVYFNQWVATSTQRYIKQRLAQLAPGQSIRIVEIGAGTGSTTEGVLAAIASHPVAYHYTDISPTFIRLGQTRFGRQYPFTTFSLLDINTYPGAQGHTLHQADIVIAANVIHATRNMHHTLQHIKTLLKPNGLLLLNEATRFTAFTALTFGLLDGWWAFDDAERRLPYSPLLSTDLWHETLTSEGFNAVHQFGMPADSPYHETQRIILAQSDGIALHLAPTEQPALPDTPPQPAPIKTSDLIRHVEQIIVAQTAHLLSMAPDKIELDRSFTQYGVDSIVGIELVNAIGARLNISLRTTALFDYPDIQTLARYLVENYSDSLAVSVAPAAEPSAADVPTTVSPPDIHQTSGEVQAVILRRPGTLDQLTVEAVTIPPPEAHQIQIAIQAFSLNFGDLLCVQGLYPNMPDYPFTPGFEVAGIVQQVGPDVTGFAPGDAVMALMGRTLGGHASLVNVPAALTIKKPASVSFENACAFPVVFLTAYSAFEKAAPQPNESILIQTAAGGVGLMAVQLAQQAKINIIATAGSDAKCDYLRRLGVAHVINYRQQDFAAEVQRITNGRGVDIVLNMLSGDNIQKGLDSLAPGGRYVEIAMTGLKSATTINLSGLVNNQSIHTIDLGRLINSHPAQMQAYLNAMTQALASGTLKPTVDQVFPFANLREAYQHMADRQNIGKVVVSLTNAPPPPVTTAVQPVPHPTAAPTSEGWQDIAIIGIAGQFPGAASLDEFWTNLSEGRSSITDVPAGRWSVVDHYDSDPEQPNKTYSKWGGFLDNIDQFDPQFFKITAREAELMDPQHRLFLQTCWSALEDAGYTAPRLNARPCGVFLGGVSGDYRYALMGAGVDMHSHAFMGNDASIAASRIAYLLNFKGASMAINTACSSSLVAIHLACQSLHSGESEVAIAGGVFITTRPDFHILASKAGMLSPTGTCRAFDDGADGFVPGEGVGVVVLKPLANAITDGDPIHGVIKGSGINQDGKTNGITAPSTLSQTELEKTVYERSGINPETITYVECHGTGTKLGDPVEIEALTKAFRAYTDQKQFCAIGSVKPNIGHTTTAAGIAGVLKVLLALRHRQIPPLINFTTPNRHIDLEHSPFYVNTNLIDWPAQDGPRRAAVSSFGFSGTNAHLILEEYPATAYVSTPPAQELPQLMVLSARSEDRLRVYARRLLDALAHDPALHPLAYTLQTGREAMPFRVAFSASSLADARAKLTAYLSRQMLPDMFAGQVQQAVPAATSHNLTELAQQWVNGAAVDWDALHQPHLPRRVAAPTYPFAPERYWLLTPNTETPAPDVHFYQYAWQSAPPVPTSVDPTAALILHHDEHFAQTARTHLKPNKQVILAPANVDDYMALFQQQTGPLDVVYQGVPGDLTNMQHLHSIIRASKAVPSNTVRRIIMVHTEPDTTGGYARSLALLGLRFTVLSCDDPTTCLVSELTQPDDGPFHEVMYRQGQRYIRVVEPVSAPTPAHPTPGGVYWITGGAGGLGLIIARHLATTYHARLMLTGRSELDSTIEAKLSDLKAVGATEARYLSSDVTDEARMSYILATIRAELGPLNGVIHAAGLQDPALVYDKDWATLRRIMAPKIDGTIILDRLTQTEPLDFFVLFSSTAAIIGDLGQCDYALSNRWLDEFARRRQGQPGKTVSINWPLWREGGMHLGPDAETFYLNTSGQRFVETTEGIHLFEASLGSEYPQVMIFCGQVSRIEQFLGVRPTRAVVAKSAPDNGHLTTITAMSLQLIADLRAMVAVISRLPIDRVDPSTDFGQLGLDSIMLKELSTDINRRYDIDLLPTDFFEHTTAERLAVHIAKTHAETIQAHYQPSADTPQPVEVSTPQVSMERTPATEATTPIAIVGMSGIMPQSPDLASFWEHLRNGDSLITEIPADRWNWRDYYGDQPGQTLSKWGGFIPDMDKFDPLFFKISPLEAECMDPQHRLFLQCVWHCIEDAGYRASLLAGRKVGVYVGVQFQEYQQLIAERTGNATAHIATGTAHAILANRISYLLDLRGPSEALDTACSSALVALHHAVRSIRRGEIESALVGGVSLALSPVTYVGTGDMGILSPDGRCKTFDKSANGYVKGEGVGAVMLKPVAQAQADGDHIYAVIRGTAENHGGRASSLTAPNPVAQAELLVAAYRDAAIDPETVTFIETHGTGTELGDPIEIEGLKRAFAQLMPSPNRQHYCGLGAVKTNTGHLEPAAGMAGLFKVLLAMQHHTLPATINFTEQNPFIKLADSPFYLVTETQPWQPLHDAAGQRIPYRAGVSAFGFGGSNAHIVIEEAPAQPHPPIDAGVPYLFVLSARTDERLHVYARRMLTYLEADAAPSVTAAEVAALVAALIGVNAADIDLSQPLAEYGLDPLQLSHLRDTLKARYQVELPLSTLAEQPDLITHLSRSGQLDLTRLTYTLQVGREALERRLAIVATDLADLQTQLRQYLAGEAIGYTSDSTAINGADLDTLLTQRDLRQLARLWAAGTTIPWAQLYPAERPRRMALPVYPFEKLRYWLPDPMPTPTAPLESTVNRATTPAVNATPPPQSESPLLLLSESWVEQPLTPTDWTSSLDNQRDKHVLVIYSNEADCIALNGLLDNITTIVPQAKLQYHCAELGNLNKTPALTRYPNVVLLLLDSNPATDFANVFELVRGFAAWQQPLDVVYLFASDVDNPRLDLEAITGLTRSARLENPQQRYHTVQVDSTLEPQQRATILVHEWLLGTNQDDPVRYIGTQRYIHTLQDIEAPTPAPVFRAGATYLITGGLGAIGQELCTHLARTYQSTLVILARSPLDAAKHQQLERIRQHGSTVYYHAVDIANVRDLQATLTEVKQQVPELHGVIHLARTVENGLIRDKSIETVRRVLRAKVAGTVLLDAATQAEPLDFFLMFSAMAAYGLPGAADYAYAAAFQNAFAHWRNALSGRPGKTRAICWGQWAIDPYSDASRNQTLAQLGIDTLTLDTGLVALAQAMAQPQPVTGAVATSNPDSIRATLGLSDTSTQPAPAFDQAYLPRNGDPADPPSFDIQQVILTSLQQTLKLGDTIIQPHHTFQDYGLDSITGVQLAAALEKALGLEVPPRWLIEYPTLDQLADKLRIYKEATPNGYS